MYPLFESVDDLELSEQFVAALDDQGFFPFLVLLVVDHFQENSMVAIFFPEVNHFFLSVSQAGYLLQLNVSFLDQLNLVCLSPFIIDDGFCDELISWLEEYHHLN